TPTGRPYGCGFVPRGCVGPVRPREAATRPVPAWSPPLTVGSLADYDNQRTLSLVPRDGHTIPAGGASAWCSEHATIIGPSHPGGSRRARGPCPPAMAATPYGAAPLPAPLVTRS